MNNDLFSRIRQKATDAFNGVSSFVKENPSPVSFVQNQMQKFGQNNPDQAGQMISRGEPIQNLLYKSFESSTPAIPYYKNRVVKPLMNAVSDVQDVFKPDATPLDKILSGGKALLNTAGAVGSANPINPFNIAYTGYEALKAAGEQAQGPTNPAKQVQAALEGALGQRTAGLGDALTSNPTAKDALNMAELPLMLMAGVKGGNFTGKYKRGDIGKLEGYVDELLKTDSYMNGKWNSRLPARETAFAELQHYASQGDEEAKAILDQVTGIMDDIGRAKAALKNGIREPKPVEEILQGNNKPVETTVQYHRPAGTEPITFVADESGALTKVKQMSKAATKDIQPTVLPSENRGLALPEQQKPVGLLPAKGGTTSPPSVTLTQALPEFKKGPLLKAWEDVARSSKGVIERSGPSGKQISSLINTANEQASMTAGGQADELVKGLQVLSAPEKATLADVIEGVASPTPAQARVAQVWNTISQDIYARAKEAGLDIGKIEKYFPHHVIKDSSPQAKSMMSRAAEKKYGFLELTRQTDLPYDKDPSVLLDYIYGANKRITEAKLFGKDDQALYDLAANVGKEGGDVGQVMKYLDQILGKNQPVELDKLSEGVRNVETVLKLNPATSLTNLTQNISTAIRTDIPSTVKAISKAISNPTEAISNARKAGEIDANMAKALSDFAGSGTGVSKWLHAIGMLGTEKVNRIIAVNAGMEYVTKLSKQAESGSKAAIRELERLGMKMGSVNALLGGKRVSQATQFATSAGELPYAWKTAIGKILTQFKSFSYKQTGLIGSEAKRIAQETTQGNIKPLVNALTVAGVAAPVMGEIINNVRSVIYNKKREDTNSMGERYVSNILAATSLGLLDSTEGLFGKYGATGVASAALGPAVGDVAKATETVATIGSDQPYERNKAVRNIVKTIPGGVGTTLSNTFVPNSYVDNYVGTNVGLGEKDKKTYQNLQSADPSKAESFKEAQQVKRDKEPSLVDKLLGKKAPLTVPAKDATAEEKKDFNDQIDDMMNAGGVPTDEQIKARVFKGSSATSPILEERMKAYKAIGSALESDTYSDEQKQAILGASGASTKDAEYFVRASKDPQVKLQEILPQIQGISNDGERLIELMKMKKMVGGKAILSRDMITYLNETGVISDNEEKALAALNYDEINNKFFFTKSYLKGGSGKISYAKAKKLFPTIQIPRSKSGSGSDGNPYNSQIQAQGRKIVEDILNKRK